MPSAPTEGLPTTILEAMACGTPVYTTPVLGVLSVVRDGETGFLMTDIDHDMSPDLRFPVTDAFSTLRRLGVVTNRTCYRSQIYLYRFNKYK
jgi:glycosyltransferase involved in cell wall biosynthesis